MIYNNVTELVGKTPIIKLNRFGSTCCCVELYGKLEKYNPTGSVKDRAALQMIKDAIATGIIKEGSVVIEPTSGNTGIALAALSQYFNFRLILVMPMSMSIERRKLMQAYGAELHLVEGGMPLAVQTANKLQEEIAGSVILQQFENLSNPKRHYEQTAREILDDITPDILVAGIGTGGTISGVGRYFKENNIKTQIIGVEPKDSPVITEGRAGAHKIQGIGAGFIPKTLDLSVVDEVLTVGNDEAINTSIELRKTEGILVGISSGAALHAARTLASREENKGKKILVILPDTGERYSWE